MRLPGTICWSTVCNLVQEVRQSPLSTLIPAMISIAGLAWLLVEWLHHA